MLLLFLPFLEGKKSFSQVLLFNVKKTGNTRIRRAHAYLSPLFSRVPVGLSSLLCFVSFTLLLFSYSPCSPSFSFLNCCSFFPWAQVFMLLRHKPHCPLPLNKAQHTSHAFLLQCSSLAPALSAPEYTVCSSGNICLNKWHLTPAVDPDAYIIYRTANPRLIVSACICVNRSLNLWLRSSLLRRDDFQAHLNSC